MADQARRAHREPMLELILIAITGLAFLAIVAAVPIEVGEELSAEHERRSRAEQR